MNNADPIRVGLVGIGRAGWGMHVPELKGHEKQFKIVAACDVLKERRQLMDRTFGCRTYARYEDLLKDREVELVDIATLSVDHFTHAVMALKAGKQVCIEKPMCRTYDEACKLKAIAARSFGQLLVRHNRHWEPGFQHIQEIIEKGLLGEVFEIKLRRVSYQRRNDWQTIKKFGGGQGLNWGPHIVQHALRFLEGKVVDQWSDLRRVAAVGDAEDHLKIILKGKNGCLVDLEISGGAALGEPEYLVWGTRGSLKSTGSQITLKYLNPHRRLAPRRLMTGTPDIGHFGTPDKLDWLESTIPVKPANGFEMTGIWDAIYNTLRLRKPYPITLDEAVEVMRVIDHARKQCGFL